MVREPLTPFMARVDVVAFLKSGAAGCGIYSSSSSSVDNVENVFAKPSKPELSVVSGKVLSDIELEGSMGNIVVGTSLSLMVL